MWPEAFKAKSEAQERMAEVERARKKPELAKRQGGSRKQDCGFLSWGPRGQYGGTG